jgi:ubiquitin carboxyl-terminal hydrolase 14
MNGCLLFHGGRYTPTASTRDPNNVTTNLRDLFKLMDKTPTSFPPLVFLAALRRTFPNFAQQDGRGNFAQQDAEECWGSIITTLRETLPFASNDARKFVDQFMTGEYITTLTCDENPQEEQSVAVEPFVKLDCHISQSVNYMATGIKESMLGKLEKMSPSLERQAVYTRQSLVSRLPAYLAVNFVRFYWKQTEGVKAKVLRV